MPEPPFDKFKNLERRIRIDPRREAYETFFDFAWGQKIQLLTAGTTIEEPVFDVCFSWIAAANTYRSPWLVVETLKRFWNGFFRAHVPFGLKLVDAVATRVVQEMSSSLSNMKQKELRQVIKSIGHDAYEAEKESPEFDANEAWLHFIEDHQFQLSIWGSQRICYGAVYHAYESFLTECLRVRKQKRHYRVGRIREVLRDMRDVFGDELTQFCIADQKVEIARLVRNALAHNGGRETDQLKDLPHGLETEGGVLQIMAEDTRSLFNALKERAYALAESTIALPAAGNNG